MAIQYAEIARSIQAVRRISPKCSPLNVAKVAIEVLYRPQQIQPSHRVIADELRTSLAGELPSISWVGAVYEHALALSSQNRSHRGVFYTPQAVVEGLLDLTLAPILERVAKTDNPLEALLNLRVADPACGTGNFLFAAAKRIASAAAEVSACDTEQMMPVVLSRCIYGTDVDRSAISLARSMAHAQGAAGKCGFEVGDSLKRFAANRSRGEKVDLVIGNPPFLNQLRTSTTRSRSDAAAISRKFADVSLTYADTAFVFLLGGLSMCKPGGTLSMVQPISLLAARDAGAIRAGLMQRAGLKSVWFANEALFSAGVRVCAPVLVVDGAIAESSIFRGAGFESLGKVPIAKDAATWGSVLAPAAARIAAKLSGEKTLGEIAHCTADFRDEYYALKGCISDATKTPVKRKIITSGTIDLAHNMWGEVPVRIHKRQYLKPVANLTKIKSDTTAKRRLEKRCAPKVMLATQTRVIEVVIDEAGECLPVTPVITLTPQGEWGKCDSERLGKIAAAVASPVACLWAVAHFGGAGLSIDAIKLSASQVRQIPLPIDEGLWLSAANCLAMAHKLEFRENCLVNFGKMMVDAYGLCEEDAAETLAWWLERAGLPADSDLGGCKVETPELPIRADLGRFGLVRAPTCNSRQSVIAYNNPIGGPHDN